MATFSFAGRTMSFSKLSNVEFGFTYPPLQSPCPKLFVCQWKLSDSDPPGQRVAVIPAFLKACERFDCVTSYHVAILAPITKPETLAPVCEGCTTIDPSAERAPALVPPGIAGAPGETPAE